MIIASGIFLAVVVQGAFMQSFTNYPYLNVDNQYLTYAELRIKYGHASTKEKYSTFVFKLIFCLTSRNLIKSAIIIGLTFLAGYILVGDLEWVF